MTLGTPVTAFLQVDAQDCLDLPLIAVRWVSVALLALVIEGLF